MAIHSVPRSGSSWLGEIVNSHPAVSYRFQPLFSYAFKSALDDDSSAEQIRSFFSKIASSEDDFITRKEDRKKGIKPVFSKKKTPELIAYKEVRYHYALENALCMVPEFKLIGLIRCPLAVLSSFKNAPREFRADLGWSFDEEWRFAQSKNVNRREDYFGYEKWKETALMFLRLKSLYCDRVHLVNYNDLVAAPKAQATALFEFLGLALHDQTKAFIEGDNHTNESLSGAHQAGDVYSVFNARSVDVGWQGKLPQQVVDYVVNDLKASPLSPYLSEICP